MPAIAVKRQHDCSVEALKVSRRIMLEEMHASRKATWSPLLVEACALSLSSKNQCKIANAAAQPASRFVGMIPCPSSRSWRRLKSNRDYVFHQAALASVLIHLVI